MNGVAVGLSVSRFGLREHESYLGRQIEERDLPGPTSLMLAQTVIVTDKPRVAHRPFTRGSLLSQELASALWERNHETRLLQPSDYVQASNPQVDSLKMASFP